MGCRAIEMSRKWVHIIWDVALEKSRANGISPIKKMSALIGAQVSKRRHKKFLCKRCLHYFWSEAKLAHHKLLRGDEYLPARNA